MARRDTGFAPPGAAAPGERTSLQTVRGRRSVWVWLGPVIALALLAAVAIVAVAIGALNRGPSPDYDGVPVAQDVPAREGFTWRVDARRLAAFEIPDAWDYVWDAVAHPDESAVLSANAERVGVWSPPGDAGDGVTVRVIVGRQPVLPAGPDVIVAEMAGYMRDVEGMSALELGAGETFVTANGLEGYRVAYTATGADGAGLSGFLACLARGKNGVLIDVRSTAGPADAALADTIAQTLRLD